MNLCSGWAGCGEYDGVVKREGGKEREKGVGDGVLERGREGCDECVLTV